MRKEKKYMEYNRIICGGTFDRLHTGHKAFLLFAFSKGEKVTIGLTTDAYVQSFKNNKNILTFPQREKELKEFLQKEGLLDRATIVAINSRFDETQIPDDDKVALLVSSETYTIGLEINKEREEKGLSPLSLLVFPMVASEKGEIISSSKIREGSIDRNGTLLPSDDFLAKPLFLPDALREVLHKPFGILFTGDIPKQFLRDPKKLVTIGDVITKRIHEGGIQQKLAVIDFAIERKKTHETLSQLGFLGDEKIIHLINPSGQLSPIIWKKLQKAVQNLQGTKNLLTIVDGEEDLFVIPLILMLPLGYFILYGQPAIDGQKEGVVILEITEQLKGQTFDVLKQFVRK